MKLREIFRYELEYRLRSGATWAYVVILFLVAIWMFLATADGAEGPLNAPERVAGASVLISLFGLLVSAALFADAALRDAQAEMDGLLFTSPVSKTEYLGGRFLGALAVDALVKVAIPLGVLVATWICVSTGAEAVGPFRLAAHVQPYFTLLLPNLVLVGAVLFTIAMLTRQVVPVYLAAIGLFVGTVVAANYPGAIESPLLASLVDPLGLGTVMGITKYWTEAERNAHLIGLPAELLWNRLLWLAIAAAVLVLLHRRFRFAHDAGGGRRRKGRRIVVAPESERSWPVNVPRVSGSFGSATTVRQTLAVARNVLAEVAASRWFAVTLLACTGLTMLWGWNVGDTVFDTSTWPVTLLVTEVVLSKRYVLFPCVLIALYAGELVWKEREVGTGQIADAAPVPEGAALLGRFLAMVAMLVAFQAASMVGGILIQALQGYDDFELGLYLRVVFGMGLSNYVLLAALAMTIHVLVDHKYVGHLLVVLGFLSPVILRGTGLVRHHLLLYGADPGWTYSDMNGFGPFAAPFVWFKLYWGAWALLLLVGAVLFWVRGQESGPRRRLHEARARLAGPVARTAGLALALILVLGGFVFYNTNVLNEYTAAGATAAVQAEYEQRYKRQEDLAQPEIADVHLRVELYPHEPAADLSGSFELVNRTGGAIDAVHVFLDPEVEARALSFDRAAEATLVDEEVGYRIYALAQPLEPGASLQLAFDVAFRPRGFRNSGIPTQVAGNGTYFHRKLLPFIGYQPMLELSDVEARERCGLAPRPRVPGPEDTAARMHRWGARDADLVHVEAIIGTELDQTAVAPGVLRRSWTEGGRRYFHYETETPIAFGGTIYSARYASLEDRWNDVELQVLHHPRHADNVDRMVRGMKAALDYYTAQFGPYPYGQLRIVEIPRYGGFGSAHPYTISFTEDAFLSRVRAGEVDQPFYGTAHEVAHTWWGGMVRGGAVRGESFLSESLANYSAMVVTEKTFGVEAGRRVYDFQMERYFLGRATQSREVPVLEIEDQPYIAYRKGAIAMITLRDWIGEEVVNAALRAFFERFHDAAPPYPTARDLYAELRAVTPEELHPLLADLFETVTLWDVKTTSAAVERNTVGEYVVTLEVVARKLRADRDGAESEVPMDDMVEIGVFAPGEERLGEALHLERHRIRSGSQTIRVTVPREPARAGVDPYRRMIDRNRDDNVVDVEG